MSESEAIERILAIFPDAEVHEDSDGQFVIDTGMTLDEHNELVPINN